MRTVPVVRQPQARTVLPGWPRPVLCRARPWLPGRYGVIAMAAGPFPVLIGLSGCRARAVEAIETHITGLQADGEPVQEEVGEAHLLSVTVAA